MKNKLIIILGLILVLNTTGLAKEKIKGIRILTKSELELLQTTNFAIKVDLKKIMGNMKTLLDSKKLYYTGYDSFKQHFERALKNKYFELDTGVDRKWLEAYLKFYDIGYTKLRGIYSSSLRSDTKRQELWKLFNKYKLVLIEKGENPKKASDKVLNDLKIMKKKHIIAFKKLLKKINSLIKKRYAVYPNEEKNPKSRFTLKIINYYEARLGKD